LGGQTARNAEPVDPGDLSREDRILRLDSRCGCTAFAHGSQMYSGLSAPSTVTVASVGSLALGLRCSFCRGAGAYAGAQWAA